MIAQSAALSAAALLACISPVLCQTTTRIVTAPSSVPPGASQTIDSSFPGFAFEQASFYNYSFNAQGEPNLFSQNLVNAVLSRTGGTPLIRVGGTSGDYGSYDPSQKDATNFPATDYGPRFDGDLVIGPSYFGAFKNWGSTGAKFEFMVPFNGTGSSHSVEWAQAGMDAIGIDNLYTLEIGNEPNFYGWFKRAGNHAAEYAKRYGNLMSRLEEKIPALTGKRIYQALDTATNSAEKLTAKAAFQAGLDQHAARIKQVAFHYYQGRGPPDLASLQTWIQHSTTVTNVTENFLPSIRYLQNNHPAIGFAFTETGYNVGSGSGKAITGNSLATALWAVDFQLYCMTVGVSRINWQQILGGSLNMWRAVESRAGPPAVTANFYSQPFVADFIGKGGDTKVAELDITDSNGDHGDGYYAAYAAYNGDGTVARVAVLNLKIWTSDNQEDNNRPSINFQLPGLPANVGQVVVHHLNAPGGALASKNLTYAGLEWTWESRGQEIKVEDNDDILDVVNGEVTISVGASSAVLIEVQ